MVDGAGDDRAAGRSHVHGRRGGGGE